MGNFSRNPTARLSDAVAKQYTGVRIQQGTPLLDFEFNELEDLRKHELQSVVHGFIGEGVPAGNDGFRIDALASGGVGTIVLTAAPAPSGETSLAIDLTASTAASTLGFLAGRSTAARTGSMPASLGGNAAESFALAAGMTLTVIANGGAPETVTFVAGSFADITAATAAEVVAAINAGMTRATATPGTGNDFLVHAGTSVSVPVGRLLVGGWEVLIESDVAYTSQALYENDALAAEWGVPKIAAPQAPVADRTDVIYVDAWEREVDSIEDDTLIHPAVGLETAIRVRRQWAVRLAENASDLTGITRLPNHVYLALATVDRTVAAGGGVNAGALTDLRKRRLTLSEVLVSPMLVKGPLGIDKVNSGLFAAMLRSTSEVYLALLNSDLFLNDAFSALTPVESVKVLRVFQDVRNLAESALLDVGLERLNNALALAFMFRLYRVQRALVDEIEPLTAAPARAATALLLDALDDLLDGSGGEPGLLQSSDPDEQPNLGAAYDAQIAINQEIGRRAGVLPKGTLEIALVSGPASVINAGNVYSFVYSITSVVNMDETIELAMTDTLGVFSFAFQGLSPDPNHPGNASRATLVLLQGQTVSVAVNMSVPGGTGAGTASRLVLNARSQRNPAEINYSNLEILVTVGSAIPLPASDLRLTLVFPDPNESAGPLPIGRASAGNNVNFEINVARLVPAATEEEFEFTVTFVGNATSFQVRNPAILAAFDLPGSIQPDDSVVPISATIDVEATGAALDGQQSQMIVRLAKTSVVPQPYFRELFIRIVADVP